LSFGVNLIGATAYAVTAGLYALLCVLLLVSWRGKRPGAYLIAAAVVSSIWGGTLAVQTAATQFSPLIWYFVEVGRLSVWILFLTSLLRDMGVSRRLGIVANAGCTALLVSGFVIGLTTNSADLLQVVKQVLFPGALAVTLLGLVLIEQMYRNALGELRWRLNFLVLGIGAMFAYDLFLYSQAVMFHAIDPAAWIVRGMCNAIFVPMIGLAARRNPDWTVRIFVSRQVVFYSTALVATGFYLLMMATGGYLLLSFGGNWGALARLTFFVGAGLVLVTLLFSTTLRNRLKVFLNKHFFHNKYDHRQEWLRLVSTLAGFEDRSTRHVLIHAMAQIVNCPGGALWVRDPNDAAYRLVAKLGTKQDFPDIASNDPIVNFVHREGWIVDLSEYERTQKHYAGLTIPGWLTAIDSAWLVIPLRTRGETIGLMLLFEAAGPPRLNYEDRDLLKTVASHIAVHLVQERSDRLLLEAQQFQAYNRLTAFLMHDLNNLIAQQSLIVVNAEKHKHNPAFVDDAIETISDSVERMQRLMKQLKSGSVDSQASTPSDLKFLVSAAVDRCSSAAPAPTLVLNGVEAKLPVNADQFTMVVTHLIRNAQQATGADGEVQVSLARNATEATLTVADTGSGMTPEFVRERLFRPFDSTKGSQGMGIGAYQAREFARSMGGDMRVESVPSKGTTVTISLPLQDQ
jgi:putative PEP-CTERM system histidine kinase